MTGIEDAPLFSVVLPFFNGQEFVRETLESVARQTFRGFEVVVVDDGSTKTEHSAYLKERLASLSDPRFRYFLKENGGLSDARNFGLRRSRGSWIAFIDQDDLWDARKLERQAAALARYPEANFLFTDGELIGEVRGDMNVASKNGLSEGLVKDSYTRLLKGNFVICSSVCFRKSMLDKVGYSNPSFKVVPDYEYVIRFAEHTDFHFIPEVLVSYRVHGANTVKNQLKQAAETLVLLGDRKLATGAQRALATYNAARSLLTWSRCWASKCASRS